MRPDCRYATTETEAKPFPSTSGDLDEQRV
jgi:hypothetical protein